jgi:hypothetical protein
LIQVQREILGFATGSKRYFGFFMQVQRDILGFDTGSKRYFGNFCYRFKEKYLRAMDQVAAAATTKETTQQKLGEDNLGNKMLQVKMLN